MFLIILILGVNNVASARFVEDPITDFTAQENLLSNEVIYKIEADLNDDGVNDIFLSSSSNERRAGKAGVSWQEYLSSPGGYITPGVEEIRSGISMPIDGVILKRLPEVNNRMSFVSFFSSGAGQGSIIVYYVDKANRIKLFNFAQINIHEIHGNVIDLNKFSKIMSGGTRYKKQTLTNKDILSLNVNSLFSGTPSEKKDNFYTLHNFVSDPNNGNTQRVYRKSDNKLVGHLENGLNFIPLRVTGNGNQKAKQNSFDILPQLRF